VKPYNNTELCWFQVATLSSETIIQVEASLLIWNLKHNQSQHPALNTIGNQSSNISPIGEMAARRQGLSGETFLFVILEQSQPGTDAETKNPISQAKTSH